MGNCCLKASISDIKDIEIPENKIDVLDQSSQTINLIEVNYNEGPLGLKLLPDNNLIVVNELVSDGHYCGQTELYNSMVPEIKVKKYVYSSNKWKLCFRLFI